MADHKPYEDTGEQLRITDISKNISKEIARTFRNIA
jgi:hypothetical protein